MAPDAKELARQQAVAALTSGNYGSRQLALRCNGLATAWGTDDIAAAASAGAPSVS